MSNICYPSTRSVLYPISPNVQMMSAQPRYSGWLTSTTVPRADGRNGSVQRSVSESRNSPGASLLPVQEVAIPPRRHAAPDRGLAACTPFPKPATGQNEPRSCRHLALLAGFYGKCRSSLTCHLVVIYGTTTLPLPRDVPASADDDDLATERLMPSIPDIAGPYRFSFYSFDCGEVHVERDRDKSRFWLDPVALAANSGSPRRS